MHINSTKCQNYHVMPDGRDHFVECNQNETLIIFMKYVQMGTRCERSEHTAAHTRGMRRGTARPRGQGWLLLVRVWRVACGVQTLISLSLHSIPTPNWVISSPYLTAARRSITWAKLSLSTTDFESTVLYLRVSVVYTSATTTDFRQLSLNFYVYPHIFKDFKFLTSPR